MVIMDNKEEFGWIYLRGVKGRKELVRCKFNPRMPLNEYASCQRKIRVHLVYAKWKGNYKVRIQLNAF
jgi:hypothetical protein